MANSPRFDGRFVQTELGEDPRDVLLAGLIVKPIESKLLCSLTYVVIELVRLLDQPGKELLERLAIARVD